MLTHWLKYGMSLELLLEQVAIQLLAMIDNEAVQSSTHTVKIYNIARDNKAN